MAPELSFYLTDLLVDLPTTDSLECLCFFFVCWMELNIRSRLAVSCAAAAAAVMVGRDAASLTTELESRGLDGALVYPISDDNRSIYYNFSYYDHFDY